MCEPGFDLAQCGEHFFRGPPLRLMREDRGGGLADGACGDGKAHRVDPARVVQSEVEHQRAAASARAGFGTRVGRWQARVVRQIDSEA